MAPIGTSGDDTFPGIAGIREFFVGLQGNDTYLGNGGLDHDVADYSFDFQNGGAGRIVVNQSAGRFQGGLAPDTVLDSFGYLDSIPGIRDIIGTQFNDLMYGGNHANNLSGGGGNDVLRGFRGRDMLTGDLGADKLYGGTQADVFDFKTLKDSSVGKNGRDTIYDFSHAQHDKIRLADIDANTKKAGNQKFSFIGDQAFHHQPGEVRIQKAAGGAYVYGDVNGDGKADFAVFLKGVATLVKGDFHL